MRTYFASAFDTQVGPFNFDGIKWTGPTGKICDEIGHYFVVPDGTNSFYIEGSLTQPPAGTPFVLITLKAGPVGQGCLSYNCAQRGATNYKVQEALRPLADRLWAQRPKGAGTLPVYVTMFHD